MGEEKREVQAPSNGMKKSQDETAGNSQWCRNGAVWEQTAATLEVTCWSLCCAPETNVTLCVNGELGD